MIVIIEAEIDKKRLAQGLESTIVNVNTEKETKHIAQGLESVIVTLEAEIDMKHLAQDLESYQITKWNLFCALYLFHTEACPRSWEVPVEQFPGTSGSSG